MRFYGINECGWVRVREVLGGVLKGGEDMPVGLCKFDNSLAGLVLGDYSHLLFQLNKL